MSEVGHVEREAKHLQGIHSGKRTIGLLMLFAQPRYGRKIQASHWYVSAELIDKTRAKRVGPFPRVIH